MYECPSSSSSCQNQGIDWYQDFGGRATWLANFVDTNDTDPTGHGTHVAGTVGGRTYGVAKKTKLFAVKVLGPDGRGNLAGILAGINLVVADAAVRIATGQCPKGVVANMSLNTGNSVTFNLAVAVAVTAGVFFAVSAGNEGKNAQLYSPGSEPSVCTVGAADHYDVKASFSNFGAGVDVFAPGVDVLSTSNEGVDATVSIAHREKVRRVMLTGWCRSIGPVLRWPARILLASPPIFWLCWAPRRRCSCASTSRIRLPLGPSLVSLPALPTAWHSTVTLAPEWPSREFDLGGGGEQGAEGSHSCVAVL